MTKIQKIIAVCLAVAVVGMSWVLLAPKNGLLGASVVQLKTNNGRAVTTVDNGATTSLAVHLENGANIYKTVCSSGCDYTTDGVADDVQIQAAIDTVNTGGGGTVFVKPGTYNISTSTVLKSNVTLLGDGATTTIFNCSISDALWCLGTASTGSTDKNLYQNIYVKNLTIKSTGTNHGTKINNTTNGGYINVEAYHTDWSASREEMVSQHNNYFYFENNYIHDSPGNGVQVNGTDNFFVTGNIVKNFVNNTSATGTYHLDDGIDIDEDFLDTHTIPSRYGLVYGNTVEGSTKGNNYRIASSQYIRVENNISINSRLTTGASILINSYNGTGHPTTNDIFVDSNIIKECYGQGIKVGSSTSLIKNIYITNNNISDCATTTPDLAGGITLDSGNVVVSNNILNNCGKSGADGGSIIVYKKSPNKIYNNIIKNSPGIAITLWNGTGSESYTDTYIIKNDVSENNANTIGYDSALVSGNISGNIGFADSVEKVDYINGLFKVYKNTATSTAYIYSGSAGLGGRLILEDVDGAGCTEISALNGTLIGATKACP
jgi:hypothetical protein